MGCSLVIKLLMMLVLGASVVTGAWPEESRDRGVCPSGTWEVHMDSQHTNWACCSNCPGGTSKCYYNCSCRCSTADSCTEVMGNYDAAKPNAERAACDQFGSQCLWTGESCVSNFVQREPVPNAGACSWGLNQAFDTVTCQTCQYFHDGRSGDWADEPCVWVPERGECAALSHANAQGYTIDVSCDRNCLHRDSIFAGQLAAQHRFDSGDVADCNELCANTSNCKAFSYSDSGLCYMFWKVQGLNKSAYTSGLVGAKNYCDTYIPEDECYIGCYKDDSSRDLEKQVSGSHDVESCREACENLNYTIFAVQHGNQCFCDHTYGTPASQYPKVDDSECFRVGHDIGHGGPWRQSVYEVECKELDIARVRRALASVDIVGAEAMGCTDGNIAASRTDGEAGEVRVSCEGETVIGVQLWRFATLTSLPDAFFSELAGLPELKTLWLYDNALQSIPHSITSLATLEKLHFYNNGFDSLPDLSALSESLTFLNLSYNNLSSFPHFITNLTKLQHLYLHLNYITVVPDLSSLTQLVKLYLQVNSSDTNQLSCVPRLAPGLGPFTTRGNFRAKQQAIDAGLCDVGFKVTSGHNYCEVDVNGCVHDGADNYANHESCEFTFTGSAVLYAVEFDIEYNSTCRYDYLEVEGKGKFCGSAFEPILVAGTTKFTFDTDYSVTRRGFMICVQSWN